MALMLSPTSSASAQQSQEQMAAYYFDNGEFQQAEQLYESLYKRTTNKYYYQRLYATYLQHGEFKEAAKLAEKRLKNYPKELPLYVDLGNAYLTQKQVKKAEKYFDRAIDAISADLSVVPDLAMAFVNIGRPDYAIRTYRTARAKTRNKQLYFNELIGVYQTMGDYAAMTQEYFDLLDNSPGIMPSVQISMQKAMLEAPDDRLANGVKEALVQRVREHPDNQAYLEMMIWFSIQQKDFEFALVQAQAVDARFPDKGGDQLLRVARISYQNESYDVAAEAYRLPHVSTTIIPLITRIFNASGNATRRPLPSSGKTSALCRSCATMPRSWPIMAAMHRWLSACLTTCSKYLGLNPLSATK